MNVNFTPLFAKATPWTSLAEVDLLRLRLMVTMCRIDSYGAVLSPLVQSFVLALYDSEQYRHPHFARCAEAFAHMFVRMWECIVTHGCQIRQVLVGASMEPFSITTATETDQVACPKWEFVCSKDHSPPNSTCHYTVQIRHKMMVFTILMRNFLWFNKPQRDWVLFSERPYSSRTGAPMVSPQRIRLAQAIFELESTSADVSQVSMSSNGPLSPLGYEQLELDHAAMILSSLRPRAAAALGIRTTSNQQ